MMISERMAARLNEQVTHEFFNEMTYYAMAYWFENAGLKVFAKFFYKQAQEEEGHAKKIAKYMVDQGCHVRIGQIPQARVDYGSAKEIVDAFVQQEMTTTRMVHEIVNMANEEKDHATRDFIDWKVSEQVEEVSVANELAMMVHMAESPAHLLMLEGRVYHMIEG